VQHYESYQLHFQLTGTNQQYEDIHSEDGHDATEVQITAACSAFGVNILVWSTDTGAARWIGYAPLSLLEFELENVTQNGRPNVYLHHTGQDRGVGNHFNLAKKL
jgi:hypothetical protein